ncbi:MAG TPA: class I SAM-dependent methyltransferase [Usitatibacteraceae bacterium]|nr:class I SAM-dependent methyltransferase [Usitatibacteraceae bacterium]
MTADARGERRGAWSGYWAAGANHSCTGTYGETYGGSVGAYWRKAFAGLGPADRVLDLATGNAVLPRMLLESRLDSSIACAGVDLSPVSPGWLDELAPAVRSRIDIRGGVDLARLPFDAGTFDLVTSQYGFEYCDSPDAVAEIARVLRPAGRVAMVLHHAAGRPAWLAARESSHLDWLLAPGGFLSAVESLLGPMARAATAAGREALKRDPAANAARERFNAAQAELASREGEGADILFEAREAAMALFQSAAAQGVAAARGRLDALREAYRASRVRLGDLVEHALDEAAVESLRERLSSRVGRVAAISPIEDQGHLMGWTLELPGTG